jgi:hypothetical protein
MTTGTALENHTGGDGDDPATMIAQNSNKRTRSKSTGSSNDNQLSTNHTTTTNRASLENNHDHAGNNHTTEGSESMKPFHQGTLSDIVRYYVME